MIGRRDFIAQTSCWLQPLHRLMHAELLKSGYVQFDETPIHCNDPDYPRGKTSTGWLWALSRPGGDVVFFWRMSRRYEELPPLLKDYRGLLHTDGYEAYPAFVREHGQVVRLSCWAHARRKFTDALSKAPDGAGLILRLIGQLYHWESEWDRRKVGARLRCALRCSHFKPTLALLKRVAEHLRRKPLPQSPLGLACGYLLNHWTSLVAHCDHSRTKLDTNVVENAIRPSALGQEELAVRRSPRRRRPHCGHLLAGCLLPTPRDRSLRLPQGCPLPPTGHDQQERLLRAAPGQLEAGVISRALGRKAMVTIATSSL